MASLGPCVRTVTRLHANIFHLKNVRSANTLSNKVVEKHRKSRLAHDKEEQDQLPKEVAPREYKYVIPEFLPEPLWYRRDRITEKLTRQDMLRRREMLEIPEFYVGSILAVTVADPNAAGKKNRFVGIVTQRTGVGLRAQCTLRNHLDGQGIEVTYDLYNPTVIKIELLKLEKRLDEELMYLRDAPPEYSTIPFSFETIPHPPGAPVPVNTIKVKLGPRPWHERWERFELKGVQDLELPERFYERAKQVAKPWEKHDLMKTYRESINEDETEEIMAESYQGLKTVEKRRKDKLRQKLKISTD